VHENKPRRNYEIAKLAEFFWTGLTRFTGLGKGRGVFDRINMIKRKGKKDRGTRE
jgi:hypothetical protein